MKYMTDSQRHSRNNENAKKALNRFTTASLYILLFCISRTYMLERDWSTLCHVVCTYLFNDTVLAQATSPCS